jgi:hypothetical protein
MPTKFIIQFQDQFFQWRQYQVQNGYTSACRTAQTRATSTGKRHRIVDENGSLVDLFHP